MTFFKFTSLEMVMLRKRGWSLQEIADACGVRRQTVSARIAIRRAKAARGEVQGTVPPSGACPVCGQFGHRARSCLRSVPAS